MFFDELRSKSDSQDPVVLSMLDSSATFVVAEFYYRLGALKIETADDLQRFALAHNERLAHLGQSDLKVGRSQVKPGRIERAIFSADVMARLVQNWRDHKGAIDQSNLARFLVLEMSTETCRKAVVALSQAGCIDRVPTPYGTTLVLSKGWLEDIFGRSIRHLQECMGRMP